MSEEETRKRTSAILGHPVSDSAWSEVGEGQKKNPPYRRVLRV